MLCRCFGKTLDLAAIAAGARQAALVVLGAPDYDGYVAHLKAAHPGQTPLTRETFFAARREPRWRCC